MSTPGSAGAERWREVLKGVVFSLLASGDPLALMLVSLTLE